MLQSGPSREPEVLPLFLDIKDDGLFILNLSGKRSTSTMHSHPSTSHKKKSLVALHISLLQEQGQ